jgi:hypothetical protein
MDKEKREMSLKLKAGILVLLGVLLGVILVSAYPILDSGIADSLLEDESPAYTYNFTQNVSGSYEGSLVFSIEAINSSAHNYGSVSEYYWISINSSTGIMTLNSTRNNETGNFAISVHVVDSTTQGTTVAALFNVTSVNDFPIFVNLANQSFNITDFFDYNINVSDEENDIPFVLNLSFIDCEVAAWSSRNCSNSTGRELFNSSNYSFNSTTGVLNIGFTPNRNDVGVYTINFSVMDNSSLGNKTTSQIVNFTVLNMNVAPTFRYLCDNERNATEDSEFTCWINVSDIDETHNVTIVSNYSWFIFNDTLTNSTVKNISFATEFNASAMVNFTPSDVNVGNWSVNVSVTDIGEGFNAPKTTQSIFWFFIDNVEDDVSLGSVSNSTIYENTVIYVNATDNDLLVPDKGVKNEVLTFASNTSWVNISNHASSGNNVTARIEIDYDAIVSGGNNNYTVKINVTDSEGSLSERSFVIEILGDNQASWNSSMQDAFIIYEGNETYLNFSQNVTDVDGDSLTFSFTNDSAFSSFRINSSTGVINFTAIDVDVGYHNITINASDGKLDSLKSFNFTVLNVNDSPSIILPLEVTNASIDANSNINSTEDNATLITLWIDDEDFKIPSSQKSYYNESLTVNLTIQGPNPNLFSFTRDNGFPTQIFPNKTMYLSVFTPNKSDVGTYNVTINVTDLGNLSSYLRFNLTIFESQHSPVLGSLENQTTRINQSFSYDINATDSEDGADDTGNLTFSYSFLSGTDFIANNESLFNTTTGVFNLTFNSSQGGKYHLNITVNDTGGAIDSDTFWIHVYDVPQITFPSGGYNFSLVENTTSDLVFTATHGVEDNLTYLFYMDNISYTVNDGYFNFTYNNLSLKNNQTFYGNGTNLTWSYAPNFTSESYGLNKNLTLIVYSSLYPELNASQNWNLNISHANAPITFKTNLGTQSRDYNTAITVNLSGYFEDYDFLDSYVNQTFNFSVSSDTSPSYITPYATVSSDWILTLPAPLRATSEFLTINATDLDGNSLSLTSALSNTFEVEFTTPSTTPTPSSGGGGGGGSINLKPYAFKIISPANISAFLNDRIEIPISLVNTGDKAFLGINLSSISFKEGLISSQVRTSFDIDSFDSLKQNESKNATLTVFFDTNKAGDYEILLNATSASPSYTDWTKVYISLQKINESDIEKYLVFTEEFIVQNPECLELKELVNEAKKDFENEEFANARLKAEQAISACEEFVSQVSSSSKSHILGYGISSYLAWATLGSFIIGISYYFYKRRAFRNSLKLPN